MSDLVRRSPHKEGVEADFGLQRKPVAHHVFFGRSAHPQNLARQHRFHARLAQAALDLQEHQGATIAGDHVDFSATAAKVASHDRPA